ncbi:nucleotidyltransferase family protein [Desulfitobacterium metallireducens]|uniref:Molybdopterin-guanine dinucleotide biosynthesis protein MobA n=1 Tax=Desulfitobacterium metallireducens DSM 15288 TaxID=871968 RepID=W0EGE7_9FIRM|nr:nucleotidyltransferase family protein [Desulfitobacterium metallireducens]AHF08136.1 molybdopterin-guanine dinucleotide biosynthesis protein MobA [Desulfitobacterium metallireducens DSM 15288]
MVRFVVMASGQATRMGQDKLALPWRNTTVLGYVLEVIFQTLKGFSLDIPCEVWVVARKSMRQYMNPAQLSENWGDPDQVKRVWIKEPQPHPLSTTLRLGLDDLSERIQGICFVPGDQVGLEPIQFTQLMERFLENQPDFLIPWVESSEGIKGSPVFFHRRYLEELRSLQGEQGGRVVLHRYPERWQRFAIPAEFLEDVDTIQDYERLFDF